MLLEEETNSNRYTDLLNQKNYLNSSLSNLLGELKYYEDQNLDKAT